MAMRPVRFGELALDDRRQFYANPVFAMACATGILKCPVTSMPNQDREQFCAWLDTLRFPCTEEFVIGAQIGKLPDFQWRLRWSFDEISIVDMMVQKYTDICRCSDLEQQIHDLSDEP